jgi:hypothetical protein
VCEERAVKAGERVRSILSLASVVVSVRSILSSPVVVLVLSVRSMEGSESVKSMIDEEDTLGVSIVAHIAQAKAWGSFEYVHAGHARAAIREPVPGEGQG